MAALRGRATNPVHVPSCPRLSRPSTSSFQNGSKDVDGWHKPTAVLAQRQQAAIPSPLAFARLARATLMHRRPLDRLLLPPPLIHDPRQLSLALP
jgi:hypothetical protein